jgi:hypothetical protein
VAPVGPVGPVGPVAPVGPVGPVGPVAPVGPTTPASVIVQAENVPEPPLLEIVTVIEVLLNVAILPSIKLDGVAVLNTRTRWPTTKAVAVDAKLVVSVNVPLEAIVCELVDVKPE